MSGVFQSAKHLVILQTEDWVLNQRVDSALPGYLVLDTRMPTNDLSLLGEALTGLGTLVANARKALYAAAPNTPSLVLDIARLGLSAVIRARSMPTKPTARS
jgi:diadenosine tetraphosphate (Ap4A) HIT family hydrolase